MDIKELILNEERILNNDIDKIAKIASEQKIVMIAGPSSAGKTTFSKILASRIKGSVLVSMDDFFVERENTPKRQNGTNDYECLQAVDLELFNQTVKNLLSKKPTVVPTYDFIKGTKSFDRTETLDTVLIIEGIHALNKEILPDIETYKIYVDAYSDKIPSSHFRLIRRCARDTAERGRSVIETIENWDNVTNGENYWVIPNKFNANIVLNTFSSYELPALATVLKERNSVLNILNDYEQIDLSLIPENTISREFIGKAKNS